MVPRELYLKFVVSRAVYDFHHGEVFNGWVPGSDEYLAYQERIEELKQLKSDKEKKDGK